MDLGTILWNLIEAEGTDAILFFMDDPDWFGQARSTAVATLVLPGSACTVNYRLIVLEYRRQGSSFPEYRANEDILDQFLSD